MLHRHGLLLSLWIAVYSAGTHRISAKSPDVLLLSSSETACTNMVYACLTLLVLLLLLLLLLETGL
jgi:hypothetical protein